MRGDHPKLIADVVISDFGATARELVDHDRQLKEALDQISILETELEEVERELDLALAKLATKQGVH